MGEEVRVCGMQAEKGRWILVLSGLLIELCLGSIYAYSVLSVPMMDLFAQQGLTVSATAMQVPYILFLLVLALTVPLVGQFLEKFGPAKVSIVGGILTGLGWFLASVATSPTIFAMMYGIVGGLGVGIVYSCPVTASARWFPDNRGFAVGLTLLGFGFSAAIVAPIADYLTANFGGIQNTFRILGIFFMLIIVLLSSVLVFPPPGWFPKKRRPSSPKPDARIRADIMRDQMMKMPQFYGLWLCYAIGTLAGLMAIGAAKPVGLEVAKNAGIRISEASILMTNLIIAFAFCNGFGRPIFGWLTDKLNPTKAAIQSFILIITASLLMIIFPASVYAYALGFSLLWLCLGGWEAIAPAATASYFGTKDYPRNYGLLITAYGVGAVSGNLLVGLAKDIGGAYIKVFLIVALLSILGIILALLLMKPAEIYS